MKKLFIMILCFSVLFVGVDVGALSTLSATRISDNSTVNSYEESIISDSMGGRYAGRVWSDKSVYANNGKGVNQVVLDNRFHISYEDDFLEVFSTLGSSQLVTAYETSILDVMLVVDASRSMGEENPEGTRMDKVVDALNNTIDALLQSNSENRIGVVVYANTSAILIPLDYYVPKDDKKYITVSDYKFSGKFGDFKLTSNIQQAKGSKEIVNYEVTNTTSGKIGGGTNFQSGIFTATKVLTELQDTTAVGKDGNIISRIPAVVFLTDGATTSLVTGSWHNVDSTSYTSHGEDASHTSGVMLSTLLSGAYMKSAVENRYNGVYVPDGAKKTPTTNKINLQIYAIGVDLPEDTWAMDRVHGILEPYTYFTEDYVNGSEANTALKDAYTNWKKWLESDTDFTFNGISFAAFPNNDEYQVTKQQMENNITFVKEYNEISSIDLDSTFTNIVTDLKAAAFHPIAGGVNGAGVGDAISYINPIGQYMEVKDVKKLMLFGKEYNIQKDKTEEIVTDDETVVRQYYKAVDESGLDATIINDSYVNPVRFKLSDIKIWVDLTNNLEENEVLNIQIPDEALPIQLDYVELDEKENVLSFKTNADDDNSLPLRIAYTVGLKNEVLTSAGFVDVNKLSEDYLKKNTVENGGAKYVNFYSGLFTAEGYTGDGIKNTTYGNAITTFAPSSENRFYIFQKNLVIYKKSSGGDANHEGELTKTGGNVVLSDPLTDISEIDKDATYYISIDYYEPIFKADGTQDGDKGRLVEYAIARKGSEFYGTDDGEKTESYVTYYNTSTGSEVSSKGPNVVVATKTGKVRVGNLNKFTSFKSVNKTGTATYFYVPTYGMSTSENTYSLMNYMGNNGKMTVPTSYIPNTIDNLNRYLLYFGIGILVLALAIGAFLLKRHKKPVKKSK